MKTASTHEIIEYLQAYEKTHGIGSVRSIGSVCNGDRTIEYIFYITGKDGNEMKVEIPVVEEDDLWKDRIKFDWEKFKTEYIAVHTKTIEEYKDFTEQAKTNKIKVADTYKTLFNVYEDYTCLNYNELDNHLKYSPKYYYKEKGYTILEWKDYMED